MAEGQAAIGVDKGAVDDFPDRQQQEQRQKGQHHGAGQPSAGANLLEPVRSQSR